MRGIEHSASVPRKSDARCYTHAVWKKNYRFRVRFASSCSKRV
jgi:hypothetical protein